MPSVLSYGVALGAVLLAHVPSPAHCGRKSSGGGGAHDHDHGEPSEEHRYVTCHSVVKLRHAHTKYYLHSHQVNYGSGSKQQSVTAVDTNADSNSFWEVRPADGETCETGDRIRCGGSVRLTHLQTQRNLHSHNVASPLSGQLEVSAYGDGGNGDAGDDFQLSCAGSETYWVRNTGVALQHKATRGWLHSHRRPYPRPIEGQLEVSCAKQKSFQTNWEAREGIYFPTRKEE
jgi:dolichyl-phosphate-mannose--protein O-mannosyl transferase|eukprot:TRINITY_DN148_c0_g1_i5.p1 TRINITY_DN148_c0_g1~~TRINITY_DN148_c0_g1_i5.p1  ORF type:complete len:231 (-),score=78.46 TRINITY_DN148_c0_g1_i5:506-1198(-)